VKFGISFTKTHLNQAGALVHVYTDGSIHLNHGGTEMGQGLFVKVAQVVAEEFQVDIDRVKITATTTGKVPNTSATAASSGTDLNGMAALDACAQIKARLSISPPRSGRSAGADRFRPNRVQVGGRSIPFAELVKQAYQARIRCRRPASTRRRRSTGTGQGGRGPAVLLLRLWRGLSEVSVDTLTGEIWVERVTSCTMWAVR
jgi:xanthine dehydrogenase large subunit